MRQLTKKVALLTGANGGLGLWLARALADAGFDVVAAGNEDFGLDEVVREVRQRQRQAVALRADFRLAPSVPRLAQEAVAAFGRVDLLVNNAGVEYSRPYHELKPEQLQQVLDVNLVAPMRLTHLLLPGMLERRAGHIVNIASLAGKSGPAFQEPYAATKSGLVAFTWSLRATYRGTGVSASVLCPGFVNVGIYSRIVEQTGCHAPYLLGPVSPDRVARAMVCAIERDQAEVIVSRFPVRPILALLAAAPALGLRLVSALGTHDFFRQVVAAQAQKPDASTAAERRF